MPGDELGESLSFRRRALQSLTPRAPISGKVRDATKRSSSTSEYTAPLLIPVPHFLPILIRASSGGHGYGCDGGSTKTVTDVMTHTVTAVHTVTMTDVSNSSFYALHFRA